MGLVPLSPVLLIVGSLLAPSQPVDHLAVISEYYEVGGTVLSQYTDTGQVAAENNREVRKLRFSGVESTAAVSGASRGATRILFDATDLDRDNPDGTRTLTVGTGPLGTDQVTARQLVVGKDETPIDLDQSGDRIITRETVAGRGVLLRGYGADGSPSLLAVYPESLPPQTMAPVVFQFAEAFRMRQSNIGFDIGYGNDRLFTFAGDRAVSARTGEDFTVITAPDGNQANGLLLSSDGIAVLRTTADSYWRLDHGCFTSLPANRFTGVEAAFDAHAASALSPGGQSLALGVSGPRPGVATKLIITQLDGQGSVTHPLLDNSVPELHSLAWSSAHPGVVYLLRNSPWMSPHQPDKFLVQSVDARSGAAHQVYPASGTVTGWRPRLYPADVEG